MEEITRFVNLDVYTSSGTRVGTVKNVIIDIASRKLDALLVGKTNPAVVEGGVDVAVPYRWVRDFDDILLLNYFPTRVALPAPAPRSEEAAEGDPEAVAAPAR